MVQNRSHQNLVGGGGADAGARQNAGGDAGVEAADGIAPLNDFCRHAPNQRCGAVGLLGVHGKVIQIDLQKRIALELDANPARSVGCGAGQHIHVDAAAQDMAVLMVRVIAADFGPAGAAEQRGIAFGVEPAQKSAGHANGTFFRAAQAPGPIYGTQGVLKRIAFQGV